MKIQNIISILCCLWVLPTSGQDTIQLSVDLASFEVVQMEDKDDPMIEYYRGNRFALTESALERSPSINLVSRGNYAPELIFRGMSGGQLNLSIDGMHIFPACTDKMDPVTSYVESNNLHAIEEGKSAANGSTLGACVDMQSSKIDQQKGDIYGQVATGVQSISEGWNTAAKVGFNKDKISGVFTGSLRKHNSYRDGHGDLVDYTQYNKLNFSAKIQSRISDHQRIQLDYIYDDAWDIGYAALPMDVSSAKAHIIGLSFENYFKQGDWSSLLAKVYGNSIVHQMDDSKRPYVPIRMDMPGWSDTYGAFAEIRSRNLSGHRIRMKLDAFVNYSKAEMTMYPEEAAPMYMLTWPDSRRTSIALFAEDSYDLDDRLSLGISGRMEVNASEIQSEFGKDHLRILGYNVDDAIIEPVFHVLGQAVYQLNSSNQLEFSLAWKERLPINSEYFGFFLFNAQDGYDYIGNPELKKEKSLQFDLSHSFKKGIIEWKNSAYYYQIYDYIVAYVNPEYDAMTIGANGVKVYENIASANLYGLESSIILSGKNWKWINVLSYINGMDANGETLAQLAPLNYYSTFTYSIKRFEIIPELQVSAKKQDPRLSFGEKATPAWAIMNVRANYRFEKKWSMQAGVENVFDHFYTTFLDWGQIPRPGRNFYLSVAYSF